MHRKEKININAAADTGDKCGLGVETMNSLLPAPTVARTRLGPHCKRKIRSRYLVRCGFVLTAMVFSYMFLSPSSPLYSANNDNQRDGVVPESFISTGKLHRTLLADSEEGSADNSNPEPEAEKSKANETEDAGLFPPDAFTKDQLAHGAIILHVIGIIYMFYALALVCDEFFVPALDVITEKLGISPDVAGATFMAAGGSAPELFTSIIGVFIAKSDVGIGTIVGSAVFNILFVIAACAFAAKEALKLTAWPLIRDVFFYSVSLILLVAFFSDEKIYWYEATILLCWYFAYVGFMKFNEDVEDKLRACMNLQAADRGGEKGVTLKNAKNRRGLYHLMSETVNPSMLRKPRNTAAEGKEIMIGGPQPSGGMEGLKSQLRGGGTDASAGGTNGLTDDAQLGSTPREGDEEPKDNKNLQHNNPHMSDAAVHPADSQPPKGDAEEDDEKPIDMSFPTGNVASAIIYIVSFPLMAPLYLTLPDMKNKDYTIFPSFKVPGNTFCAWTFIGSILWIAAFSYLMVWWATVIGETADIPVAVMGLTFLAAGTSVPDLITSVLVAKQGKGDMAVSSSVGSNIFDVTVGLPLPWLLWCIVNMDAIGVSSKGAACSIAMLFLMLILVFLAILVFNWTMTKTMGSVMLGLYVVFVVVSLGFSYEWYTCPV